MSLKIVLDTNVYISGTFWFGEPKNIINATKRGGEAEVYISREIIAELEDVLTRPDKPFHLSTREVSRIINNIKKYAFIVLPKKRVDVCKEDPKDNMVIECAVEAGADIIVTGDSHLKRLGKYKDIRILAPAQMMNELKNRNG